MRVLFDVVHPADVHFFHHTAEALQADGNEVLFAARHKDVVISLLEAFELPFTVVSSAQPPQRIRQAAELVVRDLRLFKLCRRFRPQLVLTRNPSGVHAARMFGVASIYDTDDGRGVGQLFYLAAAAAHTIITPSCTNEYYGRKHLRYPGYKETAYLHPNHFTRNDAVLAGLGLGSAYSVVRFVSMQATHDHGEAGLSVDHRWQLVERLAEVGRVVITSEAPLPPKFEPFRMPVAPHQMHDVLAGADRYVGDSQTMAAEAAVLGVPSLRCSSWSGRLHYLNELEERFRLTESFRPANASQMFDRLEEMLAAPAETHALWQERRAEMLRHRGDTTAWLLNLIR